MGEENEIFTLSLNKSFNPREWQGLYAMLKDKPFYVPQPPFPSP